MLSTHQNVVGHVPPGPTYSNFPVVDRILVYFRLLSIKKPFFSNCRKTKRNMLCIVSDVPLRWTPTWNISFVLKNILKKTFLKPMTTLYFIHLKMLRHPKPDLAIAKKLPKHQPYHKGFFDGKIQCFFGFFLKILVKLQQKTVGCQLFKTKHCHWRSSWLSRHV